MGVPAKEAAMGVQRKGEFPVREAAEHERPGGAEEEGAKREATERREEEGYAQPESSAEKGPPAPEGGEADASRE
jgi:hypothetical protein